MFKFGIESPLIITYNKMNGKVYVAEGNHRLTIAMSEEIPYLPVHVTTNWIEPNKSGNFKILNNHSDISRLSALLPEHLGLRVKKNKEAYNKV